MLFERRCKAVEILRYFLMNTIRTVDKLFMLSGTIFCYTFVAKQRSGAHLSARPTAPYCVNDLPEVNYRVKRT